MITLEQLNAIPGKHDLATWSELSSLEIAFIDEFDSPIMLLNKESGNIRLLPSMDFGNVAELLDFAEYIRRVEIEIKRMNHDDLSPIEELYRLLPGLKSEMEEDKAELDKIHEALARVIVETLGIRSHSVGGEEEV